MAEFTARAEQYPLLGALGRLVAKGDEFARKPFGYENPPAAIISDLLQIPAMTRTVENINYGSPLTHGTSPISKYLPRLNKDTAGAIEGAINLVPAVGPLARATKAGVRAAAPYAAKQALDITERFGVSPVMNVVKPVGNLNLRPSVLASQLKGPEKQKVGDFIKQINGMKGLTKEGKEGALASLKKMDQNAVVTKDYVENAFEPSKYNIVDLKNASESASAHLDYEARRMTEDDPDFYEKFAEFMDLKHNPAAPEELEALLFHAYERDVLEEIIKDMTPDTRQLLYQRGILNRPTADARLERTVLENYHDEFSNDLMQMNLEHLRTFSDDVDGYAYRDYQRLYPESEYRPEEIKGQYMEFGVAHPDAPGSYRHYELADEPLASHVRGTSNAEFAILPDDTDLTLDPNSFLIEELQSDAAKKAGTAGVLHQPHATAFKAAIQKALELGNDTVYMPTARTIASIRGKPDESFAPIYDQEVVRHGIEPLSRIEGVSIEPVMFDDVEGPATAYHKIRISPEARKEILEGQGQSLPGFAGGGGVDFGQLLVDAYNKHGAR
jgi:hypothetical protein